MARPDAVNSLSALLDGTLTPAEREQVVERVARSPEEYELLVESAALLRELEADGTLQPPAPAAAPLAAAPPPPPSVTALRPRWRVPRAAVGLALAAGVAAVLVLTRDDDAGGSWVVDGAALGPTLSGGWTHQWRSRTRGAGEVSAAAQREFRIGVHLADAEVAFGAGDAEVAQAMLARLEELLADVPGGGVSAAEYAHLAAAVAGGTTAVLEEKRASARANLSILLRDLPWFELGVWTEQARLVALAGQTALFSEQAARDLDGIAERVTRELGEETPLTQRLREIQALLAGGVTTGELELLRRALAEVMLEAGG